jgi:hypothetical protein
MRAFSWLMIATAWLLGSGCVTSAPPQAPKPGKAAAVAQRDSYDEGNGLVEFASPVADVSSASQAAAPVAAASSATAGSKGADGSDGSTKTAGASPRAAAAAASGGAAAPGGSASSGSASSGGGSSGGGSSGGAGSVQSIAVVPTVLTTIPGVNAGGGSGNGKAAIERPAGSGDDIVARRLRKAAEQETDPELRRKLWQEYVNYKKNAQTP